MAIPIVPIAAGVAVTAVLAYVFRDRIGGRKNLVKEAQSMVQEAKDVTVDAAEVVADKATKVAKEVKDSVT
ncbi:MAG: hypothetical protein GY703_19755 [Gammaproteobacteria bacterium]|nr:hypothetical protein [Gammaproteobacteria bacterium]